MKLTLQLTTVIIILAGVSASCKKNNGLERQDLPVTTSTLSSIVFPVPPYEWTSLAIPNNGQSYPSNNPKLATFVAPVGDTYYCFTGDCLEVAFKFDNSTKRWLRQPSYGSNFCLFSDSRYFFSYQSKLYYGLAAADPGAFGCFDPVTGTRTTLARFPGANAIGASPVFFVMGDKGYMFFGGGYGSFWEYNFTSNRWTDKGNTSPGGKRYDPVVFVVGDKAYIGLGWESVTSGGQTLRSYKKDWRLFTAGSTYQAVKANFPGDYRDRARGFVIGDNIFVGFGYYYNENNNPSTVRRTDFWRYNINSDNWTRQADFPGNWVAGKVSEYGNLASFSIGNSGYVVTGGIAESWRFANTVLITPQ